MSVGAGVEVQGQPGAVNLAFHHFVFLSPGTCAVEQGGFGTNSMEHHV